MFKAINIYQIVICTLNLVMFVFSIPEIFKTGSDYFVLIILFSIGSFLVYTNCYLLSGNLKKRLTFLKVNLYINLLQVLTFSLLGVSYDFVFGPRVMPYLSYGSSIDVRFFADFLNTRLSLFYKPSSVILIGINFIPLIVLILLSIEYKKYSKK